MNNKIYHLTCSCDDNYMQHCTAMVCSVLENNKGHQFVVHLLQAGLSQEARKTFEELCRRYDAMITFYDIDNSIFANFKYREHLSVAAYYRILLPTLLPESVEKILYLDCDVVVMKDITELYDLELDGYGLAAIRDCAIFNNHHRQLMGLELDDKIFCSGVMMINLKYWRENHCLESMMDYAERYGDQFYMEDQDLLNHEFRRHWFELPHKYGKTPLGIAVIDSNQKSADIHDYVFAPSILHFSSHMKPWLDISIPDSEHYWRYARLSGFPDIKKTATTPEKKMQIRKAKLRYWVNLYIHPFVPNILEMLLVDIKDIIVALTYIARPSQFKEYRIKRWMKKYGM